MDPVTLKAPAKVNLLLDITGRMPNGYHGLRMLMQTVSFYDIIEMAPAAPGNGISIQCDAPGIPADQNNLVWKAVEAFGKRVGQEINVKIRLQKNIPPMAGLGGGSSDAAAVLRGLYQWYGKPFPWETLLETGLEIGADVPYCLTGGTALVEGSGERITPLCPLDKGVFVIAKPDAGVSTADCYRRYDDNPLSLPEGVAELAAKAVEEADLDSLGRCMRNVLEAAAQCPEVLTIRDEMLSAGAKGACMTGSGSAVVGLFPDPHMASLCVKAVSKPGRQVYSAFPVING